MKDSNICSASRISSQKRCSDSESIQRSDIGINLGKRSKKFEPKKEPSTMLLAEGGCVVM